MLIYNILLIYIIILSFFYNCVKKDNIKKAKVLYLFLTFIPMMIVMGLRDKNVGTDTRSYCMYFRIISRMSLIKAFDNNPILWAILNKIFAIFGTRDINYILPLSMIILILIAKFIYDYSDDVGLSTILFILSYYYFTGFNTARQFLAIAIVINSFKYIINDDKKLIKKNIIKFLIVNLIAIGIHPTSIIFLMCLIILISKPSLKNIVKISSIFIIAMCLFIPISNFLVKYFPHYSLYVSSNEIKENGFGQGKNRNFAITSIYIIFEIILMYFWVVNNINKEKIKLHYSYIIINMFGIILGVLALKTTLFNRMAAYFMIFNIIYIPYLFTYFKGNQKYLISSLYILIMLIPYYVQLTENIGGISPYKFIF